MSRIADIISMIAELPLYGKVFGVLIFVMVLAGLLMSVSIRRQRKNSKNGNIVNKHGRSTNILLADGLDLTFNNNAYNKQKLQSNGLGWIHQLIIGATGTGKSRYFVRPNIYSLPTDPITGRAISIVVTDPKGELLSDCGAFLEEHGYVVKVFNLFDMQHSDCYNPFAYVREENDVAVLVNGIVANMGEGKNAGDHWEANASYVLKSICYYIYYELNYKDSNFGTVLKLLNEWESSENDDFKSPYDIRMEDLEKDKGSDHAAVVWWKKVSAKGNELSSIISTAQTITGIFAQTAIRTMTSTDSMELDKVGDRPTALFIITPPTTKVFNFLAALMYTQLFTLLQNKANKDYKDQGMTLPHKVWFILDEFANVGKIPDFDVQITLIRSAGMFCSIIVQSPSQVEAIYDKITPTILSNCSITLFLGAPGNTQKDDSAADFISKNLGNKTIQAEGTNVDYTQNSHNPKITHSYSATQRPLMTPDEVKRLPGDECIILLGGQKPIRAKKIQQLERCMNYDIFKEIGTYNADAKKSTTLTYKEGREKSDEIEELQRQCRAAELAAKTGFAEIDAKYMTEEGSLKPVTKVNAVPVAAKFSGFGNKPIPTADSIIGKLDGEATVSLNWRKEFGGDEDIPDVSELEALFNGGSTDEAAKDTVPPSGDTDEGEIESLETAGPSEKEEDLAGASGKEDPEEDEFPEEDGIYDFLDED